jgi:hypothetical protein
MPFLSEAEMPLPDQPWAEQDAVRLLLSDYQETLDEIHTLTDDNLAVRFPLEFDSFDTSFDSAVTMRTVNWLLALEHLYAIRTGNAELEYEAINSMLGSAIVLRGDPGFVSHLNSIAQHGVALNAIQESVCRGTLTDNQLAKIQRRLQTFDDFQTSYQRAVAGERAFALPVFDDPSKLDQWMSGPNYANLLGPRSLDALHSLEIYSEMESMNSTDLDEFTKQLVAFKKRFELMQESAGWLKNIDTVLSQFVTPAMEAVGNVWVSQVLRNRMAKTAIAIRRYKLQRGDYPANLDDLAEIGFDLSETKLLNNEPFGYRILDGKPTLWAYDFRRIVATYDELKVGAEPPVDGPDEQKNKHWRWEFE